MPDLDDLKAAFPGLWDNPPRITSRPCSGYNCVAWAYPDNKHFWDFDHHWPPEVPIAEHDDDDLAAYLGLFRWMRYEDCLGGHLEPGYLKIAVYSIEHRGLGSTRHEFHHVARQLPSGKWSSKGGEWHDFQHQLSDMEHSGFFRDAVISHFLRREDDGTDALSQAAETGLIDVDGQALTAEASEGTGATECGSQDPSPRPR